MEQEIKKEEQGGGTSAEKPQQNNSAQLIAGSIIIAGLLIAGALIYTNKAGSPASQSSNSGDVNVVIDKVSESDHILGSIDAPVKIVEFSDTECPFCKRFHNTMKQVMAEYGSSGNVAWVYRHFPLTNIHPKAQKEAEATECAAELAGNIGFWKYIDRVFEVTPSNDGLDLAELPKIAGEIGLDVEAFNECLESGRHAEKVKKHAEDAERAGADGTPYSVLITKDNQAYPIKGAREYEYIKSLIDTALRES